MGKNINLMAIMNDKMEFDKEETPELEILLKDLEMNTDKLFVDIVDGMEFKGDNIESTIINQGFINDLKIFCIDDILPNNNNNNINLAENKLIINMDLFVMMNKEER